MKEIWRKIDGYENYSVSSEGKVRNDKTGRILKAGHKRNDYEFVNLYKNGKTRQFLVHRLVAQAFIPNPDNKECVDHINTKRDDNRMDNLRWCSYRENNCNPLTSEKRSRVIIGINIENPTITIEYSQMSQTQKDGFHIGDICSCCKGKSKSHKGYFWCYKEDYENFLESLK